MSDDATAERAVLRGPRVVLRPAVPEDAEALAAMLAEPAVAAWWPRYDIARVSEELTEDTCHAIEIDGAVRGWLFVTVEDDPDYRHVALDIALSSAVHGRGYATETLRLAIRHWSETHGHHRFAIDPSATNERAIRAYAAVGFKPVGTLRGYERAPDGSWRDGLLMDLLVDELIG